MEEDRESSLDHAYAKEIPFAKVCDIFGFRKLNPLTPVVFP